MKSNTTQNISFHRFLDTETGLTRKQIFNKRPSLPPIGHQEPHNYLSLTNIINGANQCQTKHQLDNSLNCKTKTCANAGRARRSLADRIWAYRSPLPLVEQNNLANFQTGGAWEKFQTNEFLY